MDILVSIVPIVSVVSIVPFVYVVCVVPCCIKLLPIDIVISDIFLFPMLSALNSMLPYRYTPLLLHSYLSESAGFRVADRIAW